MTPNTNHPRDTGGALAPEGAGNMPHLSPRPVWDIVRVRVTQVLDLLLKVGWLLLIWRTLFQ